MSTTELSLLADQWHLTHMQLVNWGTFCGYQELQLCDQTGAPAQVVMITGESGTGKSTLFDAKTAVMMRGTTRFNTASNQTTGRARGSRERNLYSYVMGKQDDEYDPATGEARESYLRRTDGANWSAIALTFVSTAGQTFCACRLYYVSAHATGTPDAWYLTADEELDPRAMEAHVQGKFGRPQLRSAYPHARIYDGPEAFLRAVYRQLGIGQDGNGESAMKLHERIQAGTTITNVDALFKDLVIDEPGTFAKAEEACQSFVEHEATWIEMDRARRKTQDLKDIRSVHDEHERLRNEAQLLESCKPGEDGPFALWMARHQAEVLTRHADRCDEDVTALEEQMAQLRTRRSEVQRRFDWLSREVLEHGGAAIDQLTHDAEALRARLQDAQRTARQLEGHLADVGQAMPTSAAELEGLQQQANEFLDSYDSRFDEIDSQRMDLRINGEQLKAQYADLSQQISFYEQHPVNITPAMARTRTRIAQATGIPEDELPYAAELMDLAKDEEDWRVAANVGFHSIATIMLVDQRRLDAFSVDINALSLDRRVNFEGVRGRPFRRPRSGAHKLSSKLVFREDSPFAAWVAERVCDGARDYTCVDRPEDLGGHGQQITREGQTRRRSSGAHGHAQDSLIMGFTNKALVKRLRAELADVRQQIAGTEQQLRELQSQQRALQRRRDAALQLRSVRWETIDVVGPQEQLARTEAEIERLRKDKSLTLLIEERDAARGEVNRLTRKEGALESACAQERVLAETAHDSADDAAARATRLAAAGIAVSDEQDNLITTHTERAEQAYPDTAEGLSLLARNLDDTAKRVAQAMRRRITEAGNAAQQQADLLENVFRNYHDRWLEPDDPTGVTVDSYPDYLRILESLEAEQLDLHIDDWLEDSLRRAGATLAPVARAYTTDVREINRRMKPINEILGRFAFGPDRGHLEISVNTRAPQRIRDFRTQLNRWAGLATQDSFDNPVQLHRELQRFMASLQDACSQRVRGPLNTNDLVNITVIARYPDKPDLPDKVYSSLGAKSGGETQELIANILGAALLFCLGDNGQSKPSYAPVFLDEAFIKADERFTRRAIEALAGLGFQVIIAVPTSKVQAVEPVADEYVCITKNPQTSHSFIERLSLVSRHV